MPRHSRLEAPISTAFSHLALNKVLGATVALAAQLAACKSVRVVGRGAYTGGNRASGPTVLRRSP
jgi:hypothetical protein